MAQRAATDVRAAAAIQQARAEKAAPTLARRSPVRSRVVTAATDRLATAVVAEPTESVARLVSVVAVALRETVCPASILARAAVAAQTERQAQTGRSEPSPLRFLRPTSQQPDTLRPVVAMAGPEATAVAQAAVAQAVVARAEFASLMPVAVVAVVARAAAQQQLV